MSNELESFIQQHKAKLAEEKNDLQQVYYALSRLFLRVWYVLWFIAGSYSAVSAHSANSISVAFLLWYIMLFGHIPGWSVVEKGLWGATKQCGQAGQLIYKRRVSKLIMYFMDCYCVHSTFIIFRILGAVTALNTVKFLC